MVFYIHKIKIKYTVLMCTLYIVHTANDKINKRTQKDNHARERAVQYLKLNKINVLSSVSDPYHFDALPGWLIRIRPKFEQIPICCNFELIIRVY